MVPMRTTLPSKPLGSMRTSLAPSTGSKDPADRLGSGVSSTISSLKAASSLEVTIAALDLALVGLLKGGANGDDPAWTQHLELQVGVVGDNHEFRVAWMS